MVILSLGVANGLEDIHEEQRERAEVKLRKLIFVIIFEKAGMIRSGGIEEIVLREEGLEK